MQFQKHVGDCAVWANSNGLRDVVRVQIKNGQDQLIRMNQADECIGVILGSEPYDLTSGHLCAREAVKMGNKHNVIYARGLVVIMYLIGNFGRLRDIKPLQSSL